MKNKNKILIILCLVVVTIALCFIFNRLGLDNVTTLRTILNDNWLGAIIYISLLVIQIIALPINSLILIVPAIIVFGVYKAFLLSLIGMIIGSLITFYLGRLFGNQILNWLVGTSKAEILKKKLADNGKFMLPLFLLIPIFPDELVCLVAGVSNIRPSYFIVVTILTRAIDLAFTCFVGAIIPFHGWWLLLWLALFIISFIGSYLLTKYQSKI